jgi:hypothetical protein
MILAYSYKVQLYLWEIFVDFKVTSDNLQYKIILFHIFEPILNDKTIILIVFISLNAKLLVWNTTWIYNLY